MKNIKNYYKLQNLVGIKPNMNSNNPFGIIDKGNGEAIYLNEIKDKKFVGILNFLPGTGIRGKHYHVKKEEIMYVVSGKMKMYFWLPDHPENLEEVIVKKGDLITIQPNLAHGVEAIEDTLVVELSPNEFDISDVFYPKSF